MNHKLVDGKWSSVFDNLQRQARERALIITPFLQRTTVERLLGESPRNVRVVTRFNLDEMMRRVSDVRALEYLVRVGAHVKGVRHLHSKAYVFGSATAIVTSANLTHAALYRNSEFGVMSDDDRFVQEVSDYFESLWGRAGKALDLSTLEDWKSRINKAILDNVATSNPPPLGDAGMDLGFVEGDSIGAFHEDVQPPKRQSFVKFLGEGANRELRATPVISEVRRSGAHWALTYPLNKRPRRVKDGDLMFIGRFVTGPDDLMVFGRGLGMAHVPGRDDATDGDIAKRDFKAHWPHYVRVNETEFVNATLGDSVSLRELENDLGARTYMTTSAHALEGTGNTNPRKAHMQQSDVRLTTDAARLLNARLEAAFVRFGRLSEEELGRLG